MLTRFTLLALFLVWPINLYLVNTSSDFFSYFLPSICVGVAYFLCTKHPRSFFIPLLAIPFVTPKLAAFPLLTARRKNYLFLILSILVLVLTFKPFWGQTIFRLDHDSKESVIAKTYLYPHPLLARAFQNKGRIITDKFITNFFAITDPNNYFFGFHPRQITVNNQNIVKFPFLSIPLFVLGIKSFVKRKKYFVFSLIFSSIVSLSILTNFDRNDFVLWIPLSIIAWRGLKELKNTNLNRIYTSLIIANALFEISRSLVNR